MKNKKPTSKIHQKSITALANEIAYEIFGTAMAEKHKVVRIVFELEAQPFSPETNRISGGGLCHSALAGAIESALLKHSDSPEISQARRPKKLLPGQV